MLAGIETRLCKHSDIRHTDENSRIDHRQTKVRNTSLYCRVRQHPPPSAVAGDYEHQLRYDQIQLFWSAGQTCQ